MLLRMVASITHAGPDSGKSSAEATGAMTKGATTLAENASTNINRRVEKRGLVDIISLVSR